MLEILLVIYLCKKMGAVLRDKGHNPTLMQILVVLAWFGGELVGAFGAGFTIALISGEEPGMLVYPCALLAAGIAVGSLFAIANAKAPYVEPRGFEVRPAQFR